MMITEWEKGNKIMIVARAFRYLEALELAEDVFFENKETFPEFEDAEKACEKAKEVIQKRVDDLIGGAS